MQANYHTHTPRCHHAEGTEEEYIQMALTHGMKILGFSDHTPQFYPNGRVSNIRMLPEELADYTQTLEALKSKYAGEIQIHIGLEVEYYPDLFPELLSFLQDSPVEYMLLGQHWCGNEIGEIYNGRPATEDEQRLKRYCYQVAEAMQTGLFTYVAHPDLMDFVGDDKIYEKHMRWLCREANSNQIPLEINLLGMVNQKCYPNEKLWRVAGEENCAVVIGADAHSPQKLYIPEYEARALEMVETYNLKLLDTVELRPIR